MARKTGESGSRKLAVRGWPAEHPGEVLASLRRARMLVLRGVKLGDAFLRQPATVARWYARGFCAFIAGDLDLWNWQAHPYRDNEDALRVVDKAIAALSGEKKGRRRGPVVTSRPWVPPEPVRMVAGVAR